MRKKQGYWRAVYGGFALLGLGCTEDTACRPGTLCAILETTESSVRQGIERIETGNLGDVLASAGHDLVQRNPGRAVGQLDRLNTRIVSTPYQEQILRSDHYQNATVAVDRFDDEMQRRWTDSKIVPYGLATGGSGLLGLTCLGLGALTVLGLAALGAVARRE